jgi:membrane associated rhomboid family serine protease
MVSWPQALFKLVFFCILLPATVTLLHLNHAQQHSHLLFVGPISSPQNDKNDIISTKVTSFADLHGMYQGDKKNGVTRFHQVMSMPRWWHVHWPSIAHVSTILATPTSTLLKRHSTSGSSVNTNVQVVYDATTNKWCAKSPLHQICSSADSSSENADSGPISGIWTDGSNSIQVEYHSSTRQVTSLATEAAKQNANAKFRRNPNKKSKANRNLQQVLDRPTTSLLIALNVVIAFVYWNRGTSPSSVAKIYDKIVLHGEYWRSFTGAFAHFDPLHIGFNMMTLYSLGMELESSYGSIPFLFYNLSLVPITTCIMMLLTYIQIRLTNNNTALGETSTVGYSGVLFSWMVIASLERPETCPIPFFPDVCFATHQFLGVLRFNVGPIVQLFVMQFLLKRVSFVGHLAGIVAGFLLHWNLLPLELVQPAVLIPTMYLLLLWRARNVIPIVKRRPAAHENNDDDDADDLLPQSGGGRSSSLDGRRSKRERNEAIHKQLLRVRTALLVNVVLSALVFDVLGGMLLSPLLGVVYFHYSVKSHALLLNMSLSRASSSEHDDEKTRLGTLWKGFILSCVLTIVCDSMSFSGWIVSSVYWQTSDKSITASVRLISACCALLVRLCIQVAALIAASTSLADVGETGGSGLFVVVFGSTVLDNARIVGTAIQTKLTQSATWNAFEGQGVSLGGSSTLGTRQGSSASQLV